MSKFTKSGDGIFRRTFRIDVRLTEDEIQQIQDLCSDYDGSRSDKAIKYFLASAIQVGIDDGLANYYSRQELKKARGES